MNGENSEVIHESREWRWHCTVCNWVGTVPRTVDDGLQCPRTWCGSPVTVEGPGAPWPRPVWWTGWRCESASCRFTACDGFGAEAGPCPECGMAVVPASKEPSEVLLERVASMSVREKEEPRRRVDSFMMELEHRMSSDPEGTTKSLVAQLDTLQPMSLDLEVSQKARELTMLCLSRAQALLSDATGPKPGVKSGTDEERVLLLSRAAATFDTVGRHATVLGVGLPEQEQEDSDE